MSTAGRVQDLPPPSGYSRIIWERTPAYKFMNGKKLFLLYVGTTVIGYTGIVAAAKERLRYEAEQISGQIAIEPFLVAEHDRALLLQVRKNRDAEADLMKNVKGWEVGTAFGTPVYATIGADEWVSPSSASFNVHADPKDLKYRENFQYWV